MGNVITTNMDVSTAYTLSAVPTGAESGTSPLMDIYIGGLTYAETNKLIQPGINPYGYYAYVQPPRQLCSDPTYHKFDVSADYGTSVESKKAESGVSPVMDRVNKLNRPLREYLPILIKPGFSKDYTEAQFSKIPHVITNNMDIEANYPTGASGAWGGLQRYDGDFLECVLQWSFDNFETVIKNQTITDKEYISGSGVPGYVPKGANDPKAGDTKRAKQDIRISPYTGTVNTILDLPGSTYWKAGPQYGWNKISYQFGRLKVIVGDVFGVPMAGQHVNIKQTGLPDLLYFTNSEGFCQIDYPEVLLDVVSLRGSLTKDVAVKKFELTQVNFNYAGFFIKAIGAEEISLVGNLVEIDEKGNGESFSKYTDEDGIAKFPDLKIYTNYEITIANYRQDQLSGGEKVLIYILFEPTLTNWKPPPGYPTEKGYIIIFVRDKLTGLSVHGLKLLVTDGILNFYARTDEMGRTGFIIPALTDFELNIIAEADRRYLPIREKFKLSDLQILRINKDLIRRIAKSEY